LVREFSEEEVRNAINELGKEKAPGPDGLIIAFFSTMLECYQGGFDGFLH